MLVEAGVSLADYAELTDRQIEEVLCHPRNEEGRLKKPQLPKSKRERYLEELMALEFAAGEFGLSAEDRAAAERKLKQTYGVE